jgi:hypothetical protein
MRAIDAFLKAILIIVFFLIFSVIRIQLGL